MHTNKYGLGANYKPPKNGSIYTREEWQEWIDTHTPFWLLPPIYTPKGPPQLSDHRLPLFHFAVPFTDTRSFEACKRLGLLYEFEVYEYTSHTVIVERLISHIQAKYPSLKHIEVTRPLSLSEEDYLFSIGDDIDMRQYYDLDPQEVSRAKKYIQKILQTNAKFLWYWDMEETPYTGWPASTHPKFTRFLPEAFIDVDSDSDEPIFYDDSGSDTETEGGLRKDEQVVGQNRD
ncbi:hypothetical protein C8Q75DRAFT_895533 [Abortiporus biennis]|nr:hypothetical protein C8Q75DRAFT_895533 [Abortiporus biennis]